MFEFFCECLLVVVWFVFFFLLSHKQPHTTQHNTKKQPKKQIFHCHIDWHLAAGLGWIFQEII